MKNAVLFVLTIVTALTITAQTTTEALQYASDGELTAPKDYRQWIYLSSGLGMTYGPAAQAGAANPKFDNVFVNPTSWRAFNVTGQWPDKTTFVLEVRSATSHGSINNGGQYQNQLLGLEVEVKDEKRFPQKWAFFAFEARDKTAPLPASSACNTCHSQNGAVDNTFVQFYPTLLEIAKKKGTLTAAYLQKSSAGGGEAK
jgi:hypothetical protein